MRIILLGLGMGTTETMTISARDALLRADAVIGAGRLLDSLPETVICQRIETSSHDDILRWLEGHRDTGTVCVVHSGDIGLYSGAETLCSRLQQAGYSVDGINGISSVQYLCMRLGLPWHDVHLVNAKRGECDFLAHVLNYDTTFFITSEGYAPGRICTVLCEAGLGDALVTVCEHLSYPDERVATGAAERMTGAVYSPPGAVLVRRHRATFHRRDRAGILPRDAFLTPPANGPELRGAILSRLALMQNETMLVSGVDALPLALEGAYLARWGRVYIHGDAPNLPTEQERFGVYNIIRLESDGELPPVDAACVSGADGLEPLLDRLLEKNPALRVVAAVPSGQAYGVIEALQKRGLGNVAAVQLAVSGLVQDGGSVPVRPLCIISGKGAAK